MRARLNELLVRYHAKKAAHRALFPIDVKAPYIKMLRWSERDLDYDPVVYRWPDGKGMVTVEKPNQCGLRLAGAVVPELGRHGPFIHTKDIGQMGWYTDPDGYTYTNGDGLVWGVVYQLPSCKRMLRFVAGYQLGGEEAVFLDLSKVYEEQCLGYQAPPDAYDIVRQAARDADHMARQVAEDEQLYILQQREEEKEEA